MSPSCQHARVAPCRPRDASRSALGKIFGDVHARVAMVTPDEQRALQLENAKVDAEQGSVIRYLNASNVADKQVLAAKVEAQIAADKEAVAKAGDSTKVAQGRVEAIERGETVEGGLGKATDLVEAAVTNDVAAAREKVDAEIEALFEIERGALADTGRPSRGYLNLGALAVAR